MSDHFADRAAWIAALPATDPEAEAAHVHARSCQTCADALEDGRRILALVDGVTLAAPAPSVLSAVAERVVAQMKRERPRPAGAAALTVAAVFALEIALAHHRVTTGERLAPALGILGLAVLFAVASGLRAGVAGASALLTSALFAWLAGSGGGLAAGLGVKCASLELLAAVAPLAVAVVTARRHGRVVGAVEGAALAAASALAAQGALHVTCEANGELAHLLVFHVGAVLAAAAAGAAASRRLGRIASTAA